MSGAGGPAAGAPRASAAGRRWLIVVSRFNLWLTERLLDGAREELRLRGAPDESVEVAWVPGSFELPQAARAGAATGRYAGVACLGAILKGETPHDEHIASACARGIEEAALATGVPITFGVITAFTFEQAEARAETGGGRNLGTNAMAAAVEMVALFDRFGKAR